MQLIIKIYEENHLFININCYNYFLNNIANNSKNHLLLTITINLENIEIAITSNILIGTLKVYLKIFRSK